MLDIEIREHKKIDIPLRVKWLNNEKVNKYLGIDLDSKTTLEKESNWFKKYKKDISKKFFTIMLGKIPIGFMGLSNISFKNKNAELFIMIGEDCHIGKGYGEKAFKKLLDIAFLEFDLNKLTLGVYFENTNAIKLYEKLGFKKEGILKEDSFFDLKFHDTILMALFRNEYKH